MHEPVGVGKGGFPRTLPSALPVAALENVPFFLLLLRREQREESRKLSCFDPLVSYSSCINTPEYFSELN